MRISPIGRLAVYWIGNGQMGWQEWVASNRCRWRSQGVSSPRDSSDLGTGPPVRRRRGPTTSADPARHLVSGHAFCQIHPAGWSQPGVASDSSGMRIRSTGQGACEDAGLPDCSTRKTPVPAEPTSVVLDRLVGLPCGHVPAVDDSLLRVPVEFKFRIAEQRRSCAIAALDQDSDWVLVAHTCERSGFRLVRRSRSSPSDVRSSPLDRGASS